MAPHVRGARGATHRQPRGFVTINGFTFGFAIAAFLAGIQEPRAITVEQAIVRAIERHPLAAAARRDVASAKAGVASARAHLNPNVTFGPALTQYGTDNELYAEQMFEINGARSARSAMARARLRAQEAARIGTYRTVAFEAASAYYELALQQERLTVERETAVLSAALEESVRRQVEEGTRPGVELIQFEIETLRARRAVREQEARLRAAQFALSAAMGSVETPEPIAASLPAVGTVPSIDVEAAVATNPDFLQQMALADALREEARLEGALGRPDLGVAAVSQSFTREPQTGGIGLVLSLPIFDYGSRRNRITELRRAEEAQRLRAEAARARARADLRRAQERVRAAEEGLRLMQGGIVERAERLLAASRAGFQAGHTSVVAYLEAQRTYRSVRSEAIEASAELAFARLELARAAGTLVYGPSPVAEERR